MPKLNLLTPQNVIKILEKNGFKFERSKGSHRLYYNNVSKRRVTVPFHKKDLPKGTLLSILKQAGLTKDDL